MYGFFVFWRKVWKYNTDYFTYFANIFFVCKFITVITMTPKNVNVRIKNINKITKTDNILIFGK